MKRHPELSPVLVRAHALGRNNPERDTYFSPQHRLFLNGFGVNLIAAEDTVLASAKSLINDHSIFVSPEIKQVTYIHLLFDQHELIWANGILSESLYVGPETLLSIHHQAYNELVKIFPTLGNPRPKFEKLARPVLHNWQVQVFTRNYL